MASCQLCHAFCFLLCASSQPATHAKFQVTAPLSVRGCVFGFFWRSLGFDLAVSRFFFFFFGGGVVVWGNCAHWNLCEDVKGCNSNLPFGGHSDTHTHTQLFQNLATQSVRFTSVKRSSRKENTISRISLSKTCCVFHRLSHVCRRCVFRVPQNTASCKRSYQVSGQAKSSMVHHHCCLRVFIKRIHQRTLSAGDDCLSPCV